MSSCLVTMHPQEFLTCETRLVFFIKLWEELKFGQAKNQTLKIRTWPVGCAVCPLHDGFLNWAGIKVWIAIPPPSRHMFGWSLLVIASQPQHPSLILCWKLGGLGIKFMTFPRQWVIIPFSYMMFSCEASLLWGCNLRQKGSIVVDFSTLFFVRFVWSIPPCSIIWSFK